MKIKEQPILTISKSLVCVSLLVIGSGAFAPYASAATDQEKLQDVRYQIQNSNNQLNQTVEEKKSLESQVAAFDAEIQNLQAQLAQTSAEITNINQNISETEGQINRANKELKDKQNSLKVFLRTSYENQQVSIVELIFMSSSFSDFVSKKEYIDEMQIEIKTITEKIGQLKNELDNTQKDLNSKKEKLEQLKQDQILKTEQTNQQKEAKELVLDITKNNEANYQTLIANLNNQEKILESSIWQKAQEEARARAAALARQKAQPAPVVKSSSGFVSYGTVKAGDIIGYQGNSGFSSGSHLHFEIRNGSNTHVNPASYIGNGYFNHPMPGARVNQGYGKTSFWAYAAHTGIDYSGGFGAPVYASADGEIVKRVTGKGNTYPGTPDYGNYVIIHHTNGMFSLYGHLK